MKSKNWINRQKNDQFVKKAKQLGFVNRAAFKLLEIEQKFNLIKNSLESIQEKAEKDSKIHKNIDIEIRQRRDYIIVNVIDSGVGFKNKKTKELIKPYFTTKEKGTGLGLSIVDKIISDHNGSIQFLNHKNGAKVQIILPNK